MKKFNKQIIGQSLISPISAPPRTRQSAWSPPVTPPPTPSDSRDFPSSDFNSTENLNSNFEHSTDDYNDRSIDGREITNNYSPLESRPSIDQEVISYQKPSYYNSTQILPTIDISISLPFNVTSKILSFFPRIRMSDLLLISKDFYSFFLPLFYSKICLGKHSKRSISKLLISPHFGLIKSLSFSQITFLSSVDNDQLSWDLVSKLVALCASSLSSLSFEIDDPTFLNLPCDYSWLNSCSQLNLLESLSINSKHGNPLPDNFIIQVLRSCRPSSLISLSITNCLLTFEGTNWYLLHDKISPYIHTLSLTPSLRSTAGWDHDQFQKGILQIVKTSAYLKYVNLSSHTFGLSDNSLTILLGLSLNLQHLVLPCGLNDMHLISLISCSSIASIKTLDISCRCATGRFTELKQNHLPCNKFTDSVLITLMEKFMSDNKAIRKPLQNNRKGNELVELILPRFIISVKDGKKIPALKWATMFRGFFSDYDDRDAIFYKGFRIFCPGTRLLPDSD